MKFISLLSLFTGLVCQSYVYAADMKAYNLPELLTLVVAQNPAIQSQQQSLKASEAALDTAKWQYYPTPSVSVQQASAAKNDPSYQGDDRIAVFSVQQPLWTGGKLDSTTEKAQHELSQSQYALFETRQELRLRTVQAYADWFTARMKFEASDRNVQTHSLLYERIKRRVTEGLSADSDLTLALSRLQQARADQYISQNQQDAALAILSQLAGEVFRSERLLASQSLSVPKSSDESVSAMLINNPSILKSESAANAALAEIDIQKSAQWPDVVAKLEKQEGNFLVKGVDADARFLVTMQTKLGAGLSTLSAIDGAKAKHQASVSDIETAKRNATQQLLTEWNTARNLDVRLTVLEGALASSKDIQAAWDRQFVSGKKSWLDVMNAAREVAQTEAQLAEAKGGLLNSSWKLAILMQSPQTTITY